MQAPAAFGFTSFLIHEVSVVECNMLLCTSVTVLAELSLMHAQLILSDGDSVHTMYTCMGIMYAFALYF